MRDLISREAVIKSMENNSFMVETFGTKRKMIDGMMMCVEIADLPTVEAKEVVHGEWKEATPKGVHSWSKGYARCSVCDETIWNGWEMNFCPKCGADMRTSAE